MKRRNKYNGLSLVDLYLGYIFQKSTIIIFSIAILVMIGLGIVASNPGYNKIDYALGSDDFHNLYLNQMILYIQIFNCIISATLAINLAIQAISFDTMFASYISRRRICLAKLMAVILVQLLIIIIEIIIVYSIGLLVYPNFKIDITAIKSLTNLISSSLFNSILNILFTTIIPIIFIPMILLLINIVILILCNNYGNIYSIMCNLIPLLKAEITNNTFVLEAPIIKIILVILLGFIYISIYEIKDLKN